jgi:predicted GIY-YIG superfamily endonuclease
MRIEELVYGTKGNETYLTLVLRKCDIAEVSKLEKRVAVYMVYSKQGEVLYIGETTTLKMRIGEHLKKTGTKGLSPENVGYVEYAYVKADRYERAVIEGLLVNKYKPALNCDDAKTRNSMTHISEETLNDIVFYLNNSEYPNSVIAKALGISPYKVENVKERGTNNSLQLPKGYVPSVIITDELAKELKQPNIVTKELFFDIREELEAGNVTPQELSAKHRMSISTVYNIQKLAVGKYKKWEQERIKAVA